MADIVIDRSDAQIKAGIEKASDLQSSASEIDRSVKKNIIQEKALIKKGTNIVETTSLDNWSFHLDENEKYTIVQKDTYFGSSYLQYTEEGSGYGSMSQDVNFSLYGKESVSLHISPPSKTVYGNITLVFYTSTGKTFYYLCREHLTVIPGDWQNLRIKISDLVTASDANLADTIVKVKVQISSTIGTVENPCILKLGGIVLNQKARTAITFSFDDANESDYSVAYNKLKQYGWVGTSFVITETIGQNWGGQQRLSFEQMQEMKENGWLLGIHGANSYNWVEESTLEEAEASIRNCRDYFYDNDLVTKGITSCAYPHGKYNDDVIAILKGLGITLGRTTNSVFQNSPIESMYKLHIACGHLSSTLQENIDNLEKAIENGGLINIYGHVISDTFSGAIPVSVFNNFVDYIYDNYPHLVTDLSTWEEEYDNIAFA